MDKKYNEFNNLTEEERFDLLSAYIDEEVSLEERQQVQYLLDNDPEFNKLYAQLNTLSQGIKRLPIPAAETSAQQLSEQVFQRIERQSRLKRLSILAGGAISAMFAGAVLSFLPGTPGKLNVAVTNTLPESEPIAIAIDEPVILIPDNSKDLGQ